VTRSVWPDHVTVWRWHFYAGLLCIPFVLWLAATGSIYLFKPQIDAYLDRPFANLALHGTPARPSEQVAAALAAAPGAVLNQYRVPERPDSAVQVLVGKGSELKRVYVRPDTLEILRVIDEDQRFTTQIFHLHGELMAGDRGSLIVETAASWTMVMLITGLYLWWPKGSSGMAGVVYPRLRRNRRLFWRDVHAVTGFWVSFFALFLLISGLPWARSWGGLLKDVRHLSSATVARQDWTTGRSSELEQRRLASTPTDEHAGHHHGGSTSSSEEMAAPRDYHALDALVSVVQGANLEPPVLIAPPSRVNPDWSAKSDTQNRPHRAELTLDGDRGVIIGRHDFGQQPLLDRIIGTGVAAHEGQLFAPINQFLGLFTAISLWIVCISALVMWWRRRPIGALGAPTPTQRPSLSAAVVAFIVLLGVILPSYGVTLLIIWVVERAALRRWPAARNFLGLMPA
jgi:uncharacterized iron-regulated membrane protein